MDHRRTIESIATLLDPAERQAVLGDIEERGANFRGVLDIAGLVLLRQLQSWTNWRPWAMTAALFFPISMAAAAGVAIPQVLFSGRLLRMFTGFGEEMPIEPWRILGVPALAWLTGYCLGAIGKHRTAGVLIPMAAVTVWFANAISASILRLIQPPVWPIPDEGWRGPGSHEAAVAAIALLVMIPCARGFRRGLNPRPLSLFTAAAMVLLTAPATASLFHVIPPSYPWLRILAALWPLAYALARPLQNEPGTR